MILEEAYIEVYGEEMSNHLHYYYSYYNGAFKYKTEPSTLYGEPTGRFLIKDAPGATHKKMIELTSEFPNEWVLARIKEDGSEYMIEYKDGKHEQIAVVKNG